MQRPPSKPPQNNFFFKPPVNFRLVNEVDRLFQQGLALLNQGRLEQARDFFEKVVKLNTKHFDALHLLGIIAAQFKAFEQADVFFEKAIKLNSNNAAFFCNRGNVLKELKQFESAIAHYNKAINLNKNYALAYLNQGIVLFEIKKYEASLNSFDKAVIIKPDYAEAYSNRGDVLKEMRRFDEALASYDRAIELNDGYAEAFFNRGVILFELKYFEESLANYNKAIELNRDYAEAHLNRGNVLQEVNKFGEALICYDKAIELNNNYAEAYLNKSLLLLLLQDFEKGWELYEWRWKKLELTSSYRNFSQPLWLGDDSLAKKTILLHAEQGLGDTLQFCRYSSLVKKLGARVLLEVPKSLKELLKDLEGVDELIEAGKQLPTFDYHCPLLSLPLAFKTKLDTIPFSKAYLKADQNKIKYWQKRIGNLDGLKVGLVWNGGFRPDQPELWTLNARRNIPLNTLTQTFRFINVNFFSLQKGDPAESEIRGHEIEYWPSGNFFNFADDLVDFSDTAALISNMDLVIAVDTSTAHLAAALGKSTWILNRFDTCWRWLRDRNDSPWYESVKLYRQGEDRHWAPVLELVARDLIELNK